jgi:hypothetical protein
VSAAGVAGDDGTDVVGSSDVGAGLLTSAEGSTPIAAASVFVGLLHPLVQRISAHKARAAR